MKPQINTNIFININEIKSRISETLNKIKIADDKIKILKEAHSKIVNPSLLKEENENLKLIHQLCLEDLKRYNQKILKLKERFKINESILLKLRKENEQFKKIKNINNQISNTNKNVILNLKDLSRSIGLKTRKDFKLAFENLNVDIIRELDYYIRKEHLFVTDPDYKVIFEEIPEKRRPQLRGRNTIIKIMMRFRTFIKWAMKEHLLHIDPFVGYEWKSPQYGTPYYITVEERTKIAETDLHAAWEALPKEQRNTIRESMIPQLGIQRDIFIFHCMIGCRVGDLVQFTWKNVINDHISYIARKTSKECVESIEVPLNNTAKAILSKYKDILCDDRLLPFVSPQKYNDCIKMIFLLCGLTRNVTIWNSTTGREEQHPLNELASSHLARRTFIGNLYKKVQDPNMIGKLSGHVEGSRAFARYRTIDDDIKKSLVNMLE